MARNVLLEPPAIAIVDNSSPDGIFRDLIGGGPDARAMCHALDPCQVETRQRIDQGFLQFNYNRYSYTALEQL